MHSPAGWLLLGLAPLLPASQEGTSGEDRPPEAQDAATEDAAAPEAAVPEAAPLYVTAERLIVRPGEVLEPGRVLIRNGRIVAVGTDVEKPEGAREIAGRTVCAGFVDPWSALGVSGESLSDTSTGVATRTVDALDAYLHDHLREAALGAGVVAVRAQAGARAQFGGVGAVVLLRDADERVVLEDSNVAVAAGLSQPGRGGASFGRNNEVIFSTGGLEAMDPFDRIDQVDRIVSQLDLGARYRTDWIEYRKELAEWEKAIAEKEKELEKGFKKAQKDREKEQKEAEEKDKEFKEKRYREDRKPRMPKYDADREVLARVVDGELPLVVQAHRAPELRALLDKTKSFSRLRLVIAGGTEALPFADELAERAIPVIVWPAPLAKGGGADELAAQDLSLAARLHEKGVRVLLGSGGTQASATRDLPLIAALAIGHGLQRDAALAALTIEAARTFDVADRLGSVELGKDAELLVLDGEPLESTTRVQYVISGGDVVISPED